MAKQNITFPIVLTRNNNKFNKAYGKYYAAPLTQDALSLKGLTALVGFDQSVFTQDIVQGVVEKLTTVMVEQLKRGQPIKWDNLGTFAPGIEGSGMTEADLLAGKWNTDKQVKGVHINFIPENAQGQQLTSRALKDRISFVTEGVEDKLHVTANGKKETRRVITPLKDWVANGGNYEPKSEDNGGGAPDGGGEG